jgi:D-alanyl-lipoteichoic acid acyltransferase DltB (MBOAT superfamily)
MRQQSYLFSCLKSSSYDFQYLSVYVRLSALVVCGFFLLCKHRLPRAAALWLLGASLVYYGWWNPAYLLLIVCSLTGNYLLAAVMVSASGTLRRMLLAGGVAANIGLLGYYKYTDFVIGSYNALTGAAVPLQHIVLPLAISFFTFQQVAYLVDCHRGRAGTHGFVDYALFVCFFPQLIAGPIVHHAEMMPQFASLRSRVVQWQNIYTGLFLFSLGLFKKVVLADNLAVFAGYGFDSADTLSMGVAWGTSLAYTMQLYFDFSGYTDMALGASQMLNIRLPDNFISPYRAVNIQDFWRRWHITLSRWLRDYLYIPLGGSRRSESRTLVNLVFTFLLGGLWHGAGWTFVAWGAAHGAAMAVHRVWSAGGRRMPALAGWACTFLFVNLAWVLFRAESFADALKVYEGMAGLHGFGMTRTFKDMFEAATGVGPYGQLQFLLPACLAAFVFPNSRTLRGLVSPGMFWTAWIVICLFCSLYFMADAAHVSEFIYFRF